ncbi:MAG: HAMP domain-containing sensor histidine kinase [bacterium]|nr:HAMP domain-containing sensor histidine kinase [Candidatus Sumerlaeota bacterium]
MTGDYSQELTLLEQVHAGLGSASTLDEFYLIVGGMLVDPNAFGFSRAFFLRYDDRTRSFIGRLALGARSLEEHLQFRNDILEETARLKDLSEMMQREVSDPRFVQPRSVYNLRFHSLWIQLMQMQEDGTNVNAEFKNITIKFDHLPHNHLLGRVMTLENGAVLDKGELGIDGLEAFLKRPFVAGGLVSKRGLNGILIADRIYEQEPLDDKALYHFQWMINHASVSLDNVELVEQLTSTTKRLKEVDRLKTNFLSIVSHELRTPLTSIIGFVRLVEEEKVGPITPPQCDLLKRVSHHAAHLQSMVNDLLEIAEVEAGGMIDVELEAVDPLAAFYNILPKIETRRGSKNITIEPVIRNTVPLIRCDSLALERIYYHLLDNAVKFIPSEGRVTVEFDRRDNELNISIVDTGIGISHENLTRIFDHFYQVDSRLERTYGGMGIGLRVVNLLLKAVGGKITAESTSGVGSRFTITFPVTTIATDHKHGI